MKTNKIVLALMLLLAGSINIMAQVDAQILWQRLYGGTLNEDLYVIRQTSDGGFVLAGNTYSDSTGDVLENAPSACNLWVLKLDNLGVIEWQNVIGGSDVDELRDLNTTIDGGYIVGGISRSNISADKTENSLGLYDYWVLKLDSLGNIQWQNTIGGAGNDFLSNVIQTNDGNFVALGYSTSNISADKSENAIGLDDYWVVKLDAAGAIIWDNTIGATFHDVTVALKEMPDGSLFVGGYSESSISGDKTENALGSYDYWVMKLNASGLIVWQNTIGASAADYLSDLEPTADGGCILGGYSSSNISGDKTENSLGANDYWIIKLDSVGMIMWQNTIGGGNIDQVEDIICTADGGYLASGRSSSSISGDKTEAFKGFYDAWIVKINSMGGIQWQNTLGGDDIDQGVHVLQTASGDYVMACASSTSNNGDVVDINHGVKDFWFAKLKQPTRFIHGSIFADLNFNCLQDSTADVGISNKIIQDAYSGFVAISNASGQYDMAALFDSASLYVSNLSSNYYVACISADTLRIFFDSLSPADTFMNDFPVQGVLCQNLHIDMQSSIMRPCSHVIYTLNYYNDGFDTAYAAFINVEIDTAILDSIQSVFPFTQIGDSLYFNLGNVAPFESGQITFDAFVKCSSVIGTSTCVRAYIYPVNNCPPPVLGYDSSDVEVSTFCLGDTVHVVLKNKSGVHDMSSPGIITAIDDEIIQSANPYILTAGASVSFDYYVLSNITLTLKITQNPFHPQRPILILHDELCALTTPIKLNSVISHFARYDDADEYEEVCSQIIAAYDPNIKSVVPQGFTAQHFTDSNQVLEYRIDFQNTGLDTAFKVVLIDTISPWLNINTFVPLVSSHTFTTQFEGSNIVKFIFDPIALPDSNVSEPNSHGYVTFKIRPKFNTPKGTVINNFADIYFDFNAPVRTNTVFNTIYDTVLMRLGVGINEAKEQMEAHVLVFPNPTIDKFYIKLDKALQNANIKLVDVNGGEVYQCNQVNGTDIEMQASDLSKGVYFINIYDKHMLIARSKIVVQ